MPVIDNLVSDELIMNRLQGDATLTSLVGNRIYEYQAPKGTTFPYIVFYNQTAPRDIRGVGTATIMTDTLYAIKAIDQSTSYSTVKAINQRIHELLHGIQAVVGIAQQGTVVGIVREEAIKYPEVDSGKHYRHLGGLYRIFVSS